MRRSSPRVLLCGLALLATTAGTAQAGAAPAAGTPKRVITATLTADGHRSVRIVRQGRALWMAAPATDPAGTSDYREAIWPARPVVAADEMSCATWVGQSNGDAQEGVMVRIRNWGGVTRGLSVTRNIVGAPWVFNLHAWDSSAAHPFRQIGQFDMGKVLTSPEGAMRYFPWRVCLAAVGRRLAFKVWLPEEMSEPAWTNARYTGSVRIPRGYSRRGAAGWYVGHLDAGQNVEYSDLATVALHPR